ncbi:hypothetical protein RND71_025837 [Anisodus tanguticus]|uniref:Protein YIP n=1 Tax=Anisodus tanguticus TaxID=243964 RepID=A0AAE1RMM7_9SOLA|nr:hypothetical protein RND71_025837 [Anisodus tanguticus]
MLFTTRTFFEFRAGLISFPSSSNFQSPIQFQPLKNPNFPYYHHLRTMAKQFNVPPVIFPSDGNPAVQRRPPIAPFQPPRSSNPSIPFMSFDIGSAVASTSFSTPFASATIGGAGTGGGSTGFENEPPLLEELGINTKQIYQKTLSILNPFIIKPDLHEDGDLSGPFIFLMAFGLFQLLAGKIHFGIILGWVVMASMFLYIVFNMLAGRNGNLNLYRCVSLVGYCMLPIVILSALSLFLPGGLVIKVLTGVFVVWSTRVCTRLLVELASYGDEHRGLIATRLLVELASYGDEHRGLITLQFDLDLQQQQHTQCNPTSGVLGG